MGNRAGRPRVEAERYTNGKVKDRPIGPTPEQQRRKQFLIGDSPKGDAQSPMGVLVAHGLVDQQVRETITTPYLWAKKKRYGSYGPAMPGDGTERGYDSGDSDAAEKRAKQIIETCDSVLGTLPRRQRDLVDNILVMERWPAFMQQRHGVPRLVLTRRDGDGNISPVPEPELVFLLSVLQRLAVEFGVHKRPERSPLVVARNFNQSEGE